MKCPCCSAKIGLFVERQGQRRVKNGSCPNCGGEVTIAFSIKRFAILLPIVIGISALGWHTLPHNLLAFISAITIFFGTVQFEKAPNV